MAWQSISFVFIATLVIHIYTTDARAIEQDITIDEVVNESVVDDAQQMATLLDYRHRFEHSNNIKALKWMFNEQVNPKDVYCKVCHILLPVVSSFLESC